MQRILVCDTETTGVDDPILITEVAWCEVEDDLDIVEEFCTLVNPGVPIPCVASGISGIRDEDVVDSPKITDIEFPEGEITFIGHNTPYDYPLLKPHCNIIACIDTLKLARRLIKGPESYALGALSCYCGLPRQLNHRALNDVRDTLALLDWMCREFEMDLQEMYDESNTQRRLDLMPFGKHKGTQMELVPYDYIQWLLNSGGKLDDDMRFTIKQIWNI